MLNILLPATEHGARAQSRTTDGRTEDDDDDDDDDGTDDGRTEDWTEDDDDGRTGRTDGQRRRTTTTGRKTHHANMSENEQKQKYP